MRTNRSTLGRILIALATGIVAAGAGTAQAAAPVGVWIDHTGRGAVEISDCNGKLCGRIVWIESNDDQQICGMAIIGDAKPVAPGRWDGGWILDPEDGLRYNVELTPLGDTRLKVTGYLGTRLLSETMIWKRAPAELKRCTT